jgi:hypothetical protein
MPKRFTIQLDKRDVFQLLDGLELRAESWERTAEYLRSGHVEGEIDRLTKERRSWIGRARVL